MAQIKKNTKTAKKEMKKHEEVYIHVTKRSVKYFFLSLLTLGGYILNLIWLKAINAELNLTNGLPTFNAVTPLVLFPCLSILFITTLFAYCATRTLSIDNEDGATVLGLVLILVLMVINFIFIKDFHTRFFSTFLTTILTLTATFITSKEE